MKAERIVLSIIAVLIGLFVAGIVFFLYQMTMNKKPPETKHVISILPSPSVEQTQSFFSLDTPADQSVSSTNTITLSGKAPAGSHIVISQESGQDVVTATQDGTFSDQITLDDGVNLVHLTAIRPDGKEDSKTYTFSYTTENF